jgi:N-acetylmuramoyl-L-alanine amidase
MVNSFRFARETLHLLVKLGYHCPDMTIPPRSSPSRADRNAPPVRILQTSISMAILLATLFVAFSPKMFSGNLANLFSNVLNTQQNVSAAVVTPHSAARVGIVSGHWGNGEDKGAVCPDGTNEHDINLAIATLVRQKLQAKGFEIDLLQEYDSRLDNYRAAALVSIHADTCDVIDDQATGFKVAASTYSHSQNLANRLASCLEDRYSRTTGLRLNPGGITLDMTEYHAFRAINSATTAAIIETGFLNMDKDILVHHPDLVADGVVSGILCFVNNENIEPTPVTTP